MTSDRAGWRLKIEQTTRFAYYGPARASYNEVRLSPRTEYHQTALEARVVTVPAAPQYSYVDYWGTQVVAFNVDRRHEKLFITGLTRRDTGGRVARRLEVGRRGGASQTMSDYLGLASIPTRARMSPLAPRACGRRLLRDGAKWSAGPTTGSRYVRGVTGVLTSAAEA